MQTLTLLPMNTGNFEEAKRMMERSFADSIDDLPEHFGEIHGNDVLPSIDGVLEDVQATPLVFYQEEKMVGGAVVKLKEDNNNELDLLFVDLDHLDKGIGYRAWLEIEKRYPQTKTWTTVTPPCLIRNVYFYVNKCGFHIIRIDDPKSDDSMFVFQKVMKNKR
ncbi:GNAT family N-acetyltransferase [uncultured Methanospirillum sp.]|uniref:GNAT family N-acetyltransferase n=1 Tax=uncultured Methanospirillum sp. TaxID=262503 RepID=UPI0029C91C44|nr:GNAT family N-acetyltransferase [uncultured Methanospirillum sp.]